MLSLFRRRPPPAPTFTSRVDAFWRWFQEVAPRFYAAIEARQSPALGEETSARLDELLPGFSWVFGPGANDQGHSFTLTGEGNIHRQLLALEWLARAPAVEGWTFYAARQPGPIRGKAIQMDDLRFKPEEIWITPFVDQEHEQIDLTVWHPAWEKIAEGQRGTITFLFLDEALGEYGTGWWIGEIKFGRERLGDAFPLEELAEFVAAQSRERGWKKYPPGEAWTLFELEPGGTFPRGDLITQNTCVPALLREYLNADGEMPDPLAGTGADYVYVSIDAGFFPAGRQVDKRHEIEAAIEGALQPFRGGRLVGGAFGRTRGYSDFLIFDGPRSLAAIEQALRAQHVPGGTMIEFFAREKRGQRIAL